MVANQRGFSTAYTYDIYQRLKKVEEDYNLGTGSSYSTTEYNYNTLGALITVIAASNYAEQNITTMTYDSLSKKRTMSDPDMGNWDYRYDKAGNLEFQKDAKGKVIGFKYDGINRLTRKEYWNPCATYPPSAPAGCTIEHSVLFVYDDLPPSDGGPVPNGVGKLVAVSFEPATGQEDKMLRYDLMQNLEKAKKKIEIGGEEVTFEKTYDTAGRVLSIKYLAGSPNEKIYSYAYDVAGNLLYVNDNPTGNHLVDYSEFTALGQHQIANYPKPNNVFVKTSYEYYTETGKIKTLKTEKWANGELADTYQNLRYQQIDNNPGYDSVGNIIVLQDILNNITHNYQYDHLNRLTSADGVGTNPYTQSYQYDRIGNITFKSDLGIYSYQYSNKPHAVRSAGDITFIDYDNNGNMIQRVEGGVATAVQWNYDNKPTSFTKGTTTVSFTYDGSGQRVKKVSSLKGTTFYFGELYDVRGGAPTFHVFAGNNRIASVYLDGRTQFYHTDHLGSSRVITDQIGDRKERIEYLPFGAYREAVDYDQSYPDVYYTYTGQEEDDELGLYNYKARLYDPVLGRFISADSVVPYPEDPQAMNRYTYCLNNPLIYTDPSGEAYFPIVEIIISVVVSILVSSTVSAYQAKNSGENPWKAAIIGGIRAAIAYEPVTGIVDSSMAGAIQAKQAGENPLLGALLGWNVTTVCSAISYYVPYVGGVLSGMLSGGIYSAAFGDNPWKGALYGGLTAAAVSGTTLALSAFAENYLRTLREVYPDMESAATESIRQKLTPDQAKQLFDQRKKISSTIPNKLHRLNPSQTLH